MLVLNLVFFFLLCIRLPWFLSSLLLINGLWFYSGLLGGHSAAVELKQKGTHMQWYNDSLLNMAVDLGNRLLPAFNTTSGMPMARVS